MKTIALCLNLPIDVINDPATGKKYPGSGWVPHFKKMAQIKGHQVVHGNTAAFMDARDVIVVQEENNEKGVDLVMRGADPRVNFCLESPIFAASFYDNIPNNFRHSLLFTAGTEHVYFPSFDDEDIQEVIPWNDRNFLCMVTANKHYSGQTGRDFMLAQSPSYRYAMNTQLHDYRYQAIHHFIGKEGFKLYGKGWPSDWQTECDDKIDTIRNYKFALCFENGSYPGYITEKIIDCLVAGVIPIYRGAPDVINYVPKQCYIDANIYKSFEEMECDLRWNTQIIDLAKRACISQQWLRSLEGQKYNNRVFAKRILEMCE